MSEQIDWSKAPELATHYVVGSVSPFEMRDGDDWFFWSTRSRKWVKLHGVFGNERFKEQALEIIQRPTTPSWSGEGRPPVGVVCEVNPDKSGWRKSVISYVGDGFIAWLQVGDLIVPEYGAFIDDCEFRPIRTPEQIAADEREAAIGEMVQAICLARCSLDCTPLSPADEAKCASAALYDAGYRKP